MKKYQKKISEKNRFFLIEGARGLAAILVVWSHTMEKSGFFYKYLFDPGKIGVVIFFFISGYLVIPSASKNVSVKGFLLKRFFRLYPLYWASLLLALIIWKENLSMLDWLANITMAQQVLGFKNAISVYWTLTVEIFLYAVIVICLYFKLPLLIGNIKKLTFLFGLISISMALVRMKFQLKFPVAIPLGLFCMFLGAFLRDIHDRRKSLIPAIIFYLMIIMPTCLMAYSFSTGFDEVGSRYVATYFIAGVIFLCIVNFSKLNLGVFVRRLGDYSYGIYLFHMVFIYWLKPHLGLGVNLFLLTLIFSVIISVPLFYFIEKPLAEVGRAYGN